MLEKKSVINTIKRAFQSGSLQLVGQQLTQIPPELLNLENFDLSDQNWWECNPITKLDFSNNEILEISEDIAKLKDIQVIRLKSNQLRQLPKGIFFNTLKLLDVSKNKIESIPTELQNAWSLVELNLSTNNLTACPNLTVLTNLQVLYIDNNKLESISNLPANLKRLDASNNSLTIIRRQYFADTLNIQQISLNKNLIKDIESQSFAKCNKLIGLQMKENKLEKFEQVPCSEKLDSITLNFNRIKQFNKFSNCPNLTILTIADNKIQKLSGEIICLKKLKTLDVSNNDLSDLPSELGLLSALVRLQLQGNPLKCIRPNIRSSGVEQLKKYLKDRIDPNQLEKLQKRTIDPKYTMNSSLDHWDKLIMQFTTGNQLDLKNKNLQNLSPKVFERENIRILNVSKNNLSTLSEDIIKMKELRSLNLSQNAIQMLPESLLRLRHLQQLEVRRNRVNFFFTKHYKASLDNLFFLDLSANKLVEVPEILIQMPKLRTLHLSYNKISSIQILFAPNYFNHLEVIDVSNNQIAEVPDTVKNRWSTLNFLNLENNSLLKLPTVLGFMKLTALKVEGNPLKFIKRPVIMKGTVSLLEDLRNKHVGEAPTFSKQQQKQKQKQTQKSSFYSEMNTKDKINQSVSKLNVSEKDYCKKQKEMDNDCKGSSLQKMQPRHEIEAMIKQKNIKIGQIQSEVENNFSLNKMQKAQKKKQIQQLLIQRNHLMQSLK